MSDVIIETSAYVSYVHERRRVSGRVFHDETNIVTSENAADALVEASEGVVWCEDCYPDKR